MRFRITPSTYRQDLALALKCRDEHLSIEGVIDARLKAGYRDNHYAIELTVWLPDCNKISTYLQNGLNAITHPDAYTIEVRYIHVGRLGETWRDFLRLLRGY